MVNDLNTLDLSKSQTKTDKPSEPQAEPQPESTIKLISKSPSSHPASYKVIAILLIIALTVVLGYVAVSHYPVQTRRHTVVPTNSTNSTYPHNAYSSTYKFTATDQSLPREQSQGTNDTIKTQDQSTSNQSNDNAISGLPQTIYCGVSGMPENACATIISVEKYGLKNNQNVTADTSQLPNGIIIEVDETTWQQPGPELGNVTFEARVGPESYSGKAFLQVTSGTWKIISFILDQ